MREGFSEGLAVRALEAAVQGEHQVSAPAFIVHAQQTVLHLGIAAGGALQLYQALEGGVGGSLAQHHVYASVLQRKLLHPEGAAVRRNDDGAALRAPLHHDGVDEGGGIGPKLFQMEGDVVIFSRFQGARVGDKAHGGGAVPAYGAAELGLGGEEARRVHALHLLRQVHAELGILRHHAAGIGLDVRGKFLGRWRIGLLGSSPAGGKNGRRSGHQ